MKWWWLVLLGACGPYAGKGVGTYRVPVDGALQPRGDVTIRWTTKSELGSGTMHAKLPDGREFDGTFVQPQRGQWNDSYGPSFGTYYGAWSGPWGRMGPYYSGTRGGFSTHYADSVLAHLESKEGVRMRCTFALYAADRGIAGGGQGDCQLSTNEEIFDAVLERY